jgi:hypothetical protein
MLTRGGTFLKFIGRFLNLIPQKAPMIVQAITFLVFLPSVTD